MIFIFVAAACPYPSYRIMEEVQTVLMAEIEGFKWWYEGWSIWY
jgi:hypothetical protein